MNHYLPKVCTGPTSVRWWGKLEVSAALPTVVDILDVVYRINQQKHALSSDRIGHSGLQFTTREEFREEAPIDSQIVHDNSQHSKSNRCITSKNASFSLSAVCNNILAVTQHRCYHKWKNCRCRLILCSQTQKLAMRCRIFNPFCNVDFVDHQIHNFFMVLQSTYSSFEVSVCTLSIHITNSSRNSLQHSDTGNCQNVLLAKLTICRWTTGID